MSPYLAYWNVLHALILRDIRTRFFGHGVGYLVFIAWPLVHIGLLVTVWYATGRSVPYGDSAMLFFSAGLVPVVSFHYMSRFIMMAAVLNKPLLNLPAVKPLDLFVARAVLECLAACVYSAIVLFALWVAGIGVMPVSAEQASLALAASLLLGLGFGCMNGVIALARPMWQTGYTLIAVTMFITSGAAFVVSSMPEILQKVLAYNPILHAVEWMRVAYIPGYPDYLLDRTYLVSFGLVALAVALVSEKTLRKLW